jgi:purine-nucleoside phosphorylase
MKQLPEFFQLEQFQISPVDVTQMVFHCDPDKIHQNVILMPCWQPEVFGLWVDEITTITKNVLYNVVFEGEPISIVRSGVGAPLAGDAVLALGCTECERILFAGSVGGLRPDIRIGDLMVPEYSYSGDGFCRYLQPGFPLNDCFLDRMAPDEDLSLSVSRSTNNIAREADVVVHTGPVFSIDSILTQFSRLEYLTSELGCIGIEMESAAVFKAARLVGIRAAALLSVSDVPVRNQTLYAGRSQLEKDYRKGIRSKILAKALLVSFQSSRN